MIQRYSMTAVGEKRIDIVSRISMLYLQRHVDVESLTFTPEGDGKSRYNVCAVTDEGTVRRIVGLIEHIEGIDMVGYELA